MSRYYGILRGKAKTEATREGTTNSGLEARCQGWNAGVRVSAFNVKIKVDHGEERDCFRQEEDRDCFLIRMTTGSSSAGSEIHIGYVTDLPGGPQFSVELPK